MSFFSDLFEGNFGNLGTDITHAPDSLSRHPSEIIDTGAALLTALTLGAGAGAFGGAALGGDAALGGIDAGIGVGGIADAGLGAADLGAGAADLGAADAAFGAFDPGLFAANSADVAAGGLGVDAATLAGDFAPTFAGDFAPLGGDALGFVGDAGALPESSTLATGSLDLSSGPADLTAANDMFGTFNPETVNPTFGTPSGFAQTDAELTPGAQTGTATTSGGGAASSGGGGFMKTLTDITGSPLTRLGLGAAPLGLALLRGEPQLPSSAVAGQQNAAALSTFGQQQLAQGQAGQLNAGQLAVLQQMRQTLTNQYRQALYNEGVTNPEADTRWAQMQAQIEMQVTAQTETMIQQEIKNGLDALGAAGTQLNQIAQMQMTADQNFTNTLVNATKALAFAIPGSRPSVNIGSGLALSAAA